MNIEAIVYKSNTGYTKENAELLSKLTSIPCYNLKDAVKELNKKTSVIFMGWLMAGTIKGYKVAKRHFDIKAVCAVGMLGSQNQSNQIVENNKLGNLPIFLLQGGLDINKLHDVYKWIIQIMKFGMCKGLSEKADKTPEEILMLDLVTNGGSRVTEKGLQKVVDWINSD